MKKVIIFDFFGVICSEVAPRWIQKRLPAANAEELREKYIRPVDLGKNSDEELFQTLGGMTGLEPSEVLDEWQELVAIDTDLVTYIKELKKFTRIALCSNAWTNFIRPILDSNNLNQLFDVITISGEIGYAKPDKEIYLATIKSLNVSPSDCIFVDDNPKNIAVAQVLGMTGVLFTSVADLKSELKD
ncbi:MAG: HAD family phosphatase [Candidatus Colwellbacteria bacterium]|nr:HAD family phosphatase [Candidatus Colwellbacteria bacterium]